MAQDYVWKVSYLYYTRKGLFTHKRGHSQVFTNKIAAIKFMNKMENDVHAKGVKLVKWRGTTS